MVGNSPQQKQQGKMENKGNAKPEVKNEPVTPQQQNKGRPGQGDHKNFHHQNQQRGGGGGGGFGKNRGGGQQNRRSDNRGNQQQEPKQEQDASESTQESPGMAKKFTGRCRLFVGNLPLDFTEDDFKALFQPYGEFSEAYVNGQRGFGFIRMDYRHNAEAAKVGLDGTTRKSRTLRVRFATHAAALKVKNLHPTVTNELLEQAFTQFGELERAIVIVDDRGKSTGEGIVEFVRKPGAQQALRRINEGVFLLGASPRPVVVEPLDQKDEEDGMPEKFMNKNDPAYKKEREIEVRFAQPGTFDYDMGLRWKQMVGLEKDKMERVKKEMEEAQMKLEDEMQSALYDYQAEQIRKDLLRQQEELRRLEERKQQDQMRRRQEMEMRNRDEERMRQEEERRRQDMMLRQGGMGGPPGGRRMMEGGRPEDGMNGRGQGGAPPMQPPPIPPSGMGISGRSGGPVGDRSVEGQMHPMMGGRNPGNPMSGQGGAPMRQSRFDQTSPNFDGGMGAQGGPGGPRGGMYGAANMGGAQGMRGAADREMMARRREGGPNEDFGDLKRMRRF